MPYVSTTFFQVHLRVTSAASQRVEPDQPGIRCFGFPAEDGGPPLVVVWDEDLGGASATNSIGTILRYLAETWMNDLPVDEALVVERDSSGDFDHASPIWAGRGAPVVDWKPLRWPGVEPRSREAFIGMFGDRARAVLILADNA